MKPAEFEITSSCTDIQFQCSDGSCISDIGICDGEKDCNDAKDEDNCSPVCWINKIAKFQVKQCRGTDCKWHNCECGSLYFLEEDY